MRNLLILFLIFFSLKANDIYTLGEGVQMNSLPVYVGAYFSVDYQDTESSQIYRIDDLALLVYGNNDKLSYMAEVEYKELYTKTYTASSTLSTQNNHIYIERLYLEYNYNENYNLQMGKYNSPIGFWNLLPINVLRETSSYPISTQIIFPTFTTGLDISYSSYANGEIKVDFMLQNNKDFDDDYNNYRINKHYGLGLSYANNNYTFKINAGYFHSLEDSDNKAREYLLLSVKYETDLYRVLSEIGAQNSDTHSTTKYAGYIQGEYRFTQKHIAILRLESYDDKRSSIEDNFSVLGYTYRPLYPVAMKVETQVHSQSNFNKTICSLSVLF